MKKELPPSMPSLYNIAFRLVHSLSGVLFPCLHVVKSKYNKSLKPMDCCRVRSSIWPCEFATSPTVFFPYTPSFALGPPIAETIHPPLPPPPPLGNSVILFTPIACWKFPINHDVGFGFIYWVKIHQSPLDLSGCKEMFASKSPRSSSSHTFLLPPVICTLTNRRVYVILFFARPLGVFFFSCGSTCTWEDSSQITIAISERVDTGGGMGAFVVLPG